MNRLKIIDPAQERLESDLVFYKSLSIALAMFLMLAIVGV